MARTVEAVSCHFHRNSGQHGLLGVKSQYAASMTLIPIGFTPTIRLLAWEFKRDAVEEAFRQRPGGSENRGGEGASPGFSL